MNAAAMSWPAVKLTERIANGVCRQLPRLRLPRNRLRIMRVNFSAKVRAFWRDLDLQDGWFQDER